MIDSFLSSLLLLFSFEFGFPIWPLDEGVKEESILSGDMAMECACSIHTLQASSDSLLSLYRL